MDPENNEIIKQNYLELDYNNIREKYKKIHIIGNPPFGRQSSMLNKFIKKSCEYCDSISFILPKSFKKDSMKRKFTSNFHLLHEIDLPDNSFLVNNIDYNVPCVFQIWIKQDHPRELSEKNIPINYNFTKKNNNPDISFRRVGVNAGVIDKYIENKSEQSHYFIKFINNQNIDECIKKLKKITFEFNNTFGPKSISKQELIIEFNKHI